MIDKGAKINEYGFICSVDKLRFLLENGGADPNFMVGIPNKESKPIIEHLLEELLEQHANILLEYGAIITDNCSTIAMSMGMPNISIDMLNIRSSITSMAETLYHSCFTTHDVFQYVLDFVLANGNINSPVFLCKTQGTTVVDFIVYGICVYGSSNQREVRTNFTNPISSGLFSDIGIALRALATLVSNGL
eukprot:TRINITY_DN1933_c0_g1_i1.p1 TRINITY_DN1933_c0_g1~~TRINITY_DN1933_c0_g1_i1.p1  ORF type:complete len:191 (-),score=28.57 TRINITY_DN1933_c0_g1_i1:157-729(-)